MQLCMGSNTTQNPTLEGCGDCDSAQKKKGQRKSKIVSNEMLFAFTHRCAQTRWEHAQGPDTLPGMSARPPWGIAHPQLVAQHRVLCWLVWSRFSLFPMLTGMSKSSGLACKCLQSPTKCVLPAWSIQLHDWLCLDSVEIDSVGIGLWSRNWKSDLRSVLLQV